jgi:hypothetical protein
MTGAPTRYFQDKLSVSASPGFTWGRSGNTPANTWLLNDTVPSNKAGRLTFLTNAFILNVFVASEEIDTYDVGVYEHSGGTPVLLTTVSIVATRGGSFPVNVAVTDGEELAVKIDSGSCKNPVVGLILTGDF